MGTLKRPYYGLHQILTGQYTPGGEYVLDSGVDYIGGYHVLPNSQIFTGVRPTLDSVELFEKRTDVDPEVLKYNTIKELKASEYVSPISYQPFPNSDDYEFGILERYFVQKRTNPLATIIEIDAVQYNRINVSNSPGINGVIWNHIIINWRISKMPLSDISQLNSMALSSSELKFPGIRSYLSNDLEFYRGS